MPSNLRNYFKKERASSGSESFFCRGAPSELYADDAPRDRANPYAGLNGPSFYNTAERSLRDPAPYPVPPTPQPRTYSSEIHISSKSRDPRRQGAIYQNGIVLPPEARRSEYGHSSHQYTDNSPRHRSRSAQPSPGLSGAYPEPDYIPLSLSHLDYARYGGGEQSRLPAGAPGQAPTPQWVQALAIRMVLQVLGILLMQTPLTVRIVEEVLL